MAKKLPPAVLEFFRESGRAGGLIGGKKAAESLTPEARTERAKKAAAASAAVRRAAAKKRG